MNPDADDPHRDALDLQTRPGAGLELWTHGVEKQLDRVMRAGFHLRQSHWPDVAYRTQHPDASEDLHVEVYFLALAIRRVLLFHEALSNRVADSRFVAAREKFDQAVTGANAKKLRDYLEHVDEYLLDSPHKHDKTISGRSSPVLHLMWKADNVVVSRGDEKLDVTLMAEAAVELGKTSSNIWADILHCANNAKAATVPTEEPAPGSRLEVDIGVSVIIGSLDEPPEISLGTPRDVRIVSPESGSSSRLG